MRRRTFLATGGVALGAVLAGCAGGSDDEGEAPAEEQFDTVETVVIQSGEFDPTRASIEPGDAIRWENDTGSATTLTAGQYHDDAVEWEFNELIEGRQESSAIGFDEPGIYHYHASTMGQNVQCGAVLVGDVEEDSTLPCE